MSCSYLPRMNGCRNGNGGTDMQLPSNQLKARMQAGEAQFGLWLNTASPIVAELVGSIGYDWCLIDGEHGPQGLSAMVPQVQALAAAGAQTVMRIPDPQVWMVKQVLDLGVQTVLVPMVDTGEQAAEMGRAARYPPHGIRGMGSAIARASSFGAMTDYTAQANDQVCMLVQAESKAALANIDAIAGAEGVDGVFIGPADLSADMGLPADHPEVLVAIDHMVDRILAEGKIAGILTFSADRAQYYAQKGVTFVGVGADVAIFRRALESVLKDVKG